MNVASARLIVDLGLGLAELGTRFALNARRIADEGGELEDEQRADIDRRISESQDRMKDMQAEFDAL